MPDLQDLALALRNRQLSYKQSLVFSYEGYQFVASTANILWLERQIAIDDRETNFLEDVNGYPAYIKDVKGLWQVMLTKLKSESINYFNDAKNLRGQIERSVASIPPAPEDEE